MTDDVIAGWNEDQARRTPREVARDTVAWAVHDAAVAELGEARLDSDPEASQREHAAPLHKRRHALRCVEVAHELGLDLDPWVANARATGSTWQDVADTIGTTRQGAHRRYADTDKAALSLVHTLYEGNVDPLVPLDGHDDLTESERTAGGRLRDSDPDANYDTTDPDPDPDPGPEPDRDGVPTGLRLAAQPVFDDETLARFAAYDEDDRQARLDEQQWHEDHDR